MYGTYEPNTHQSNCQNVGGGVSVHFDIYNGDQQAMILDEECISQNTSYTATGCDASGGLRQYGLFSLDYDPTTGPC